MGLPTTTLLGGGKGSDSCPAGQKVDEAVTKQQDLLAEFEKIADELNRVLANLEGQHARQATEGGVAVAVQHRRPGERSIERRVRFPYVRGQRIARQALRRTATQEAKSSSDVSTIMDDMQSYFERRRFMQFKTVLDDMRKEDVIGGLRQLGDDLPKENGLSIAQCEFWSDTLDRWAEDLVDPTSGGT